MKAVVTTTCGAEMMLLLMLLDSEWSRDADVASQPRPADERRCRTTVRSQTPPAGCWTTADAVDDDQSLLNHRSQNIEHHHHHHHHRQSHCRCHQQGCLQRRLTIIISTHSKAIISRCHLHHIPWKASHFYLCDNFSRYKPILITVSLWSSQINCEKAETNIPPHHKSVAAIPCEISTFSCTVLYSTDVETNY